MSDIKKLKEELGRRSKYVKTLVSEYWQEVARRVRIRDNHRCRRCGKTYNLEVHHLTYKDEHGVSIVGRELEHLDKLILLCDVCHQKAHGKSK